MRQLAPTSGPMGPGIALQAKPRGGFGFQTPSFNITRIIGLSGETGGLAPAAIQTTEAAG